MSACHISALACKAGSVSQNSSRLDLSCPWSLASRSSTPALSGREACSRGLGLPVRIHAHAAHCQQLFLAWVRQEGMGGACCAGRGAGWQAGAGGHHQVLIAQRRGSSAAPVAPSCAGTLPFRSIARSCPLPCWRALSFACWAIVCRSKAPRKISGTTSGSRFGRTRQWCASTRARCACAC
jgi:hypothetical protein